MMLTAAQALTLPLKIVTYSPDLCSSAGQNRSVDARKPEDVRQWELDEVLASFIDNLDSVEACYGDPGQQPNPYNPLVRDEFGLRTFLEPCYALISKWIMNSFGVDLRIESHRAHAPCYPDVTGVTGPNSFPILPGEVKLKRQYVRPEGASDNWLTECFLNERYKVCKILYSTYGYMLACKSSFAFATTYEETWLMTTLPPNTLPVPTSSCDGTLSVDSDHKTLWVSRSFGKHESLSALALLCALFVQVKSPYPEGGVDGLPFSKGYDVEDDLPGGDGLLGQSEGSSGDIYAPGKESTPRRAGEEDRKMIVGSEIFATKGAICYRGIISDKLVVIKLMDRVKNGKADQLLRNEIQAYVALEELQGICVPKLVAWGTVHGGLCCFLATSFSGRALGHVFAEEHQQSCESLKSMKKEALSVLGKIHEKGWVHGDLHPENILVTGDGSLFFCDLGACARPPKGAEQQMMEQERRTLKMIFDDLSGISGRRKGTKKSTDEDEERKNKKRSRTRDAKKSSYEDTKKKKKRRSGR